MSQQMDSRDFGSSGGVYGSSHERGARRRKFAGYLKAANELRQSYQQSYGLGGHQNEDADENNPDIPGALPDLAMARNGDEELVLFPSYARQHQLRKNRQHEAPGASDDLRSNGFGDSNYWKNRFADYERDNSVVDVDVRGWIYSPHRGAMTRKNRILMGVARHLSGIPAPSGGSNSRASSPPSTHHGRVEARNARHDEDIMEREAESIIKKGEDEAAIARQGGYSEQARVEDGGSSKHMSPKKSRSPSSGTEFHQKLPHQLSNVSLKDSQNDAPGPGLLEKRVSWNHPSDMSPAELAIANAHLMSRLKPFLTTPLVSTPLTVFFYNNETSKSRTITTDDSGHFNLRAPLDFVPTHVRVLASDKLSATEEVRVTGSTGISMISDIDDTIKHSAISSGTKEIFRNTFIRDLGDLTIKGVREWYSKMEDMGVKFHYVSNSPWQLYPVLIKFFAEAGLPKGSFHLKQYSGMLQGIFEPVAERKKGTLERILKDFPKRRFIMVGDSGEADLELYTDLVLSNPGRILGVFIRDVTTSEPRGFFNSSMSSEIDDNGSGSALRRRQRKGGSLSPKRSIDFEERPSLPPRQQTRSASTLSTNAKALPQRELSKFNAEMPARIHRSMTNSDSPQANSKTTTSPRTLPPSRPSKPSSLRSYPSENHSSSDTASSDVMIRKQPPPLPKPRKPTNTEIPTLPIEPSPLSQTQTISPPRSRSPSPSSQSYTSSVRNKLSSAYNALPSWHGVSQTSAATSQSIPPMLPSRPQPPSSSASSNTTSRLPPPIPPRRNISSYPAAAAHYATNRISGGWSNSSGDSAIEEVNGYSANTVNKKVDLWNRRWARANDIFEAKGVLLRSWRVGGDVMNDAARLVEKAEHEGRGEYGFKRAEELG